MEVSGSLFVPSSLSNRNAGIGTKKTTLTKKKYQTRNVEQGQSGQRRRPIFEQQMVEEIIFGEGGFKPDVRQAALSNCRSLSRQSENRPLRLAIVSSLFTESPRGTSALEESPSFADFPPTERDRDLLPVRDLDRCLPSSLSEIRISKWRDE